MDIPAVLAARLFAYGALEKQVISLAVQKAEEKESLPRCDFCFLRDRDLVKCQVLIWVYSLATCTCTRCVSAVYHGTEVSSSATSAARASRKVHSASCVLCWVDTSSSWPKTRLFSPMVLLVGGRAGERRQQPEVPSREKT